MDNNLKDVNLPKIPFIFDFDINPKWCEAQNELKNWTKKEIPQCEEDTEVILKSISIIFEKISSEKLIFLSKAYIIFVEWLDCDDWKNYDTLEERSEYLNKCVQAYSDNDKERLKELSSYFYKLTDLFKNYEQNYSFKNDDEDQFILDNFIKRLTENLNEIMLSLYQPDFDEFLFEGSKSIMDENTLKKCINQFVFYNINYYHVILAKLYFNKTLKCEEIESDSNYKELVQTVGIIIGILNDIYSYPMEVKTQSSLNIISKLNEWTELSINECICFAQDLVDEKLQEFDKLSKKILNKFSDTNKTLKYIDFWKKMYCAALYFCTHLPKYSKYFPEPLEYNLLRNKLD